MLGDHLRRRMSQPIGERYIREVGAPEDLDKLQVGVADILNVMPIRALHIADPQLVERDVRKGFGRKMRRRSKPVHLVVDGLPAHKTKLVKRYVESPKGRLTLHFLPGYAPELNPDELVWSVLQKHMRGGVMT